jgi:hypothetical protein
MKTVNLTLSRHIDFGPVELHATDDNQAVVELAGWKAYAHVRKNAASPLVLDFAPVIAVDDAAGLITLPQISHDATAGIAGGTYVWDMILEDPTGYRGDPVMGGTVTFGSPITQPA